MRKYVIVVLTIVIVTALAVSFALVSGAAALPTFTAGAGSVPACESCHSGAFPAGVHAVDRPRQLHQHLQHLPYRQHIHTPVADHLWHLSWWRGSHHR